MATNVTRLPRFVIDAGNAFVKSVIADAENIFPHKVALLLPHEYDDGQKRFGKAAALDFVRIAGQSYAVGKTAENYEVTHRVGAPKYNREYYGVLLANAIARTFIAEPDLLKSGLRVMASHASRDYEFSPHLIESIRGKWEFECGGVKFKFSIDRDDVQTYEEPFGGACRRMFEKGRGGHWKAVYAGKAVGVIDIGGGTCGVLAIDEDGNVMYGMSDSGGQGMNQAVTRMITMLKKNHAEFFQQGANVKSARVRQALATGIYVGGGREIPCAEESKLALNPLLNEVMNLYSNKLNGGTDLDVIVLTGGGNASLGSRVAEMIKHGKVIMSDAPDEMQFSNVRGARDFDEVMETAL